MSRPVLSLIIATLNSSSTLPLVLQSIRRQTLPRSQYEILIVDGGSTDQTLSLAAEYGCRIIINHEVEQNFGKFLGFNSSRGRYLLYLDSDEVLGNDRSLEIRLFSFRRHPQLNMLFGSGYQSPDNFSIINRYVNNYGDPFSLFMYRFPKQAGNFINHLKSICPIVYKTDDYYIFNLDQSDNLLFELTAGGGMVDKRFIREKFPEVTLKPGLLNHLYYMLRSSSGQIIITRRDVVLHYSVPTLTSYLHKLSWRISGNIHFQKTIGAGGFSGRMKFQPGLINQIKKYLFLPYAVLVLPAFVDSLFLVYINRDVGYLVHLPLCLFVAWQIIIQSTLKLFGVTPVLQSYGTGRKLKPVGK